MLGTYSEPPFKCSERYWI